MTTAENNTKAGSIIYLLSCTFFNGWNQKYYNYDGQMLQLHLSSSEAHGLTRMAVWV